MKSLEPQIAKLLDTYVSSDAVKGLETPSAQADTIASAMARTLTERVDKDDGFLSLLRQDQPRLERA